ncbi:holin [Modestobacter sp. Leaf380]|uniref:holin n=1 Tax=Modestobacter sp. Leaf380 TaxID=1736356 RepID=UPI0009E8B25C|nr:holin [Modestobacter sp. Leaf380]
MNTAERATKTGAPTLAAHVVTAGVTALTVDWISALAATGTGVLASLLTSVASGGFGRRGTASAPPMTESSVPRSTYPRVARRAAGD